METITKVNSIKEKLIAEFESSKNSLFGDVKLRAAAMESFSKQGIPGRKSEEYKYVNMEQVLKGEFSFGANGTFSREKIEKLKFLKDAIVVVIENGVFANGMIPLDLPKGLSVVGMAEASKSNSPVFKKYYSSTVNPELDPFAALNTAMAKDGVFVHVSARSVIEQPIHIIHLLGAAENTIVQPRNLIVVEKGAQATIVESYATIDSKGKTFNNALTELVVEELAIVDHYKIQEENENGYLLSTTNSVQKQQSVFSTHTFTLSGSLVRNNLTMVLDGEHIESHLNGLYLTNGSQVVDNHTLVDHQKPNCNSNELYKGIIEDRSAATFNGKIYVRKDAQKTNAFQSNKNILLSDDGTINTKPQLEIYADDVKCSHGTSTGKLDEDKIFYLRARGLSETSAKKLLMHAFASEVVDTIKVEALRDYVEAKISKRFE